MWTSYLTAEYLCTVITLNLLSMTYYNNGFIQ